MWEKPATGSSICVTGVPQKIGINDVETMTDFLVQQWEDRKIA